MDSNKFLKVLIPFMVCFVSGQVMFADVEKSITVYTSVPTYATITKSSSSVERGRVDASTGNHSGLSSVFSVETNGTDENYNLYITAHIPTEGGSVSAYGDDGRLLFAHKTNLPTSSAVTNALAGEGENKNIIAYPTVVTATNGMSSTFELNHYNNENCYVIKLNGAQSGNVTHSVTGTPILGTYSIEEDLRGEYKATISFTLIGK